MRLKPILKQDFFTLSATKIKKFYDCPKCYILEYEMKVQGEIDKSLFEFGTAIHDCIEHYVLEGEVKEASLPKEKQDMYNERLDEIKDSFFSRSLLLPEIEFLVETDLRNPYLGTDPKEPESLYLYWFFDLILSDMPYWLPIKAVKVYRDVHGRKKVDLYDKDWNLLDYSDIPLQNIFYKNIEIKTGKKWSYNDMKISPQFLLYQFVLMSITNKEVPQVLYNFVKWGDTQKEPIGILERDANLFMINKVINMLDVLKHRKFPKESSCGFFSPYHSVCKDLVIDR